MDYRKTLEALPPCDVLVCGAGPAGLCAAVTASRQGLDTVLTERYGMVGGMLTLGNVTTIMGAVAPGTIRDELAALLQSPNGGTAIDPEHAKGALIAWLAENGVRLRLQTPVADAVVEEGVLRGAVLLTARGPVYQPARMVIDATGDGYVAFRAGCEAMVGRPKDGLVQPVSLMYHIAGVDPEVAMACRHEEDDTILPNGRSYLKLTEQAAMDGTLPRNVTIVRLYPMKKRGEYLVNATQANGIRPLEDGEAERAEIDLRKQMEQVNAFLRARVPGFSEIYTRVSAATLGVRESRRIRGQYVLHDEDLIAGRRFEDVMVHRANFSIDIHNPEGGGQAETEGCPHRAQPYDIPMRSMQPLGAEHLILCGRCISGTHRAHASYRVMGICMAMGQAAGMMAASALAGDGGVAGLDAADVQRRLRAAGCELG